MSDDFVKFLENLLGKKFGKEFGRGGWRVIPIQIGGPPTSMSKLSQEVDRVSSEIQQKVILWGVPQEHQEALYDLLWGTIDLLLSNLWIRQLECLCTGDFSVNVLGGELRKNMDSVSETLREIYKMLIDVSTRQLTSLCIFMRDVPPEDIRRFLGEKFHELNMAILSDRNEKEIG